MTAGDLILGAAIGMASAVGVFLLQLVGRSLRRRRWPRRREANAGQGKSDSSRTTTRAATWRRAATTSASPPELLSAHNHWALVREGALPITASVAIAVVVAIATSSALPRHWTASAILYVGQSLTEPSFDYGGLLASQLLTPTYARLATGRELLTAVVEELGLDEDPDSLAQRVVADAPAGGTLITISGTARSPGDAVELTNAVAAELLRRAPAERADQADLEEASEEIDADIKATSETLLELLGKPTLTTPEQTSVAQLQQRLEALQSTRVSLSEELATRSPNALTLVDQSRIPGSPSSPSRGIIAGVAGGSSAAAAILLVYAFAGMRRSSLERMAES